MILYNTALHNATYRGNADVVIALLSHGADPKLACSETRRIQHLFAVIIYYFQSYSEVSFDKKAVGKSH